MFANSTLDFVAELEIATQVTIAAKTAKETSSVL
jgi:hypothetical protein